MKENSLYKITPVVLWIAPPQKYLNPHRHSYPNFESNEWKRFLFASAERHSTDSFMFHNCNGEQRGHFIISINNTRGKIIRHSFCKWKLVTTAKCLIISVSPSLRGSCFLDNKPEFFGIKIGQSQRFSVFQLSSKWNCQFKVQWTEMVWFGP